MISFNRIGTNNLRTDTDDLSTTGVYLAAVSPQTITVRGNLIHDNVYGIFTAGPITVAGAQLQLVRACHESDGHQSDLSVN